MGKLLEFRKIIESQKTVRTSRLKPILSEVFSIMKYKDDKINEQANEIRRLNKKIQRMSTRKTRAVRLKEEAEHNLKQSQQKQTL